jgi:hypothetical protein
MKNFLYTLFRMPPQNERLSIPPIMGNLLLDRPLKSANNSAYISYKIFLQAAVISTITSLYFLLRYAIFGDLNHTISLADNGEGFAITYMLVISLPLSIIVILNLWLAKKYVSSNLYENCFSVSVNSNPEKALRIILIISLLSYICLPKIIALISSYFYPEDLAFFFVILNLSLALCSTYFTTLFFNSLMAFIITRPSKG